MTGRPSAPKCPAALAPATASGANQTALPPDHAPASARVDGGVEAPDADDIATLRAPEPIGDIEGVRGVWWSLARQGHRLPAQRDVILIDGFQSTKLPAKRRQ